MIPRLTAVAAAIACAFAAGPAQANGTDPAVVAGQASFSTQGSSLSITNSPGAIINWQGFSIGTSETTRFIQQSAASSVLNRVIGPDPSVILGTLTSNGRVFLINPSGILFGQGARIDVAGLVASTLNLSNQDFLAGRLNFASDPLAGTVENQGSITTPSGGSVYLVGANISNSGIINSPQGDVILAAGQSVSIFDTSTPGVRVELTASDNAAVNLGEILAQSGQVGIYGAALRNAGIIDADQVVRDASGKIVLRAKQDLTLEAGSRLSANGEQGGEITVQSETGTTLVSGTIDAKGTGAGQTGGIVQVLGDKVGLFGGHIDASGDAGGGTVLVGGDYQGKNPEVQNASATYVSPDSSVKADAIVSGNGGKVIVWSDGDTSIGGTLTARGGANSGDGGFIEISGKHVLLADNTRVNTLAPHGKTGLWLLDPTNYQIGVIDGVAGDQTPDEVIASLASSNRTITATNDITVGEAVEWTTARTLTLNAGHDVLVNAAMTASTGGAGITLIAGNNVTVTAALTASANGAKIDMSAGNNVSVNVVTASDGGSVNLRANNNVIVNGVITADTGLDAVILRADNDGTGPGAAGGTVTFVGTGRVITPRTIIRFNPNGYANTSTEITNNYVPKVSALLDAKAWVFALGTEKVYNGSTNRTATVDSLKPDLSNIASGASLTTVGALFDGTGDVGTDKPITFDSYTLTDSTNNYALFTPFGITPAGSGTTTANITKAGLLLTGSQVYNGGTSYLGTNLTANGITGETFAIDGTGNATNLASKDFQTGSTLATLTGLTLGAGNAGTTLATNYNAITTVGSLVDVTKAGLLLTGSQVYNGGTSYLGANLTANGITGETFSIDGTGNATNLASKDFQTGSTLATLTGLTLGAGNAGTTLATNYNAITTVGSLVDVTKAGLLLTGSQVYNGGTSYLGANLTANGITGETFAIDGTGNATNLASKDFQTGSTLATLTGLTLGAGNAGTTLATNYNAITTVGSLVDVMARPITLTAPSVTKIYDGGTTYTTTGADLAAIGASAPLVGTDTISAATIAYTSRDFGLGNKTVTLSCSTISDGNSGANYTILAENGNSTSTINKAALTVAANPQSKVYGTIDPTLTYTTGAFQFGDTAGSVLSGALSRPAGENVGSYLIGQNTLASNANYTIAYTGNNLGITPAALNVAANPQSKLFGASDPALTFSVTGLVNNPALGIADIAGSVLSGALTRVPGESALGGPYAITQGSLAANSNYSLGFTPNILIITGAAAEPVLGFNADQVVFAGVINSEFYYRPGNFWHISLNPNDADPGFDVMRGTGDSGSRLSRSLNSCDSVSGGGFCETWSFPQQREKINK